jgi:hypothetical protein
MRKLKAIKDILPGINPVFLRNFTDFITLMGTVLALIGLFVGGVALVITYVPIVPIGAVLLILWLMLWMGIGFACLETWG